MSSERTDEDDLRSVDHLQGTGKVWRGRTLNIILADTSELNAVAIIRSTATHSAMIKPTRAYS